MSANAPSDPSKLMGDLMNKMNGSSLAVPLFDYAFTSKYSVECNVVNQRTTEHEIRKTLAFLSNVLKSTLGPYGTTTLISNSMLQHTATKDGFSVLKEIAINEPIGRTVLDLVKRISFRLVRTVGDGSTTAVVASNSLYEQLKSGEFNSVPPKDLMDALRVVSKILQKYIDKASTVITDDDLLDVVEKIAFISTNNDNNIAKIMRSIYANGGRYVNINVETSGTNRDHLVNFDSGLDIPRGMINPLMALKKTEVDLVCNFEKPAIFMCSEYLQGEDITIMGAAMDHAFNTLRAPILFVAKGFSSQVREFLNNNKMGQPNMLVCAVDMATETRESINKFSDLAAFVGCRVYDKARGEKPEDFIKRNGIEAMGRAEETDCRMTSTRVIGGQGDAVEIAELIESLELSIKELAKIEDIMVRDNEINDCRRRIASLSNSMARIRVGGESAQEIVSIGYLIEDAAFACRSAIEHGQVIGGSLIIPKLIRNNKEMYSEIVNAIESETIMNREQAAVILDLVSSAFEDVFSLVIRESERHFFRNGILEQLSKQEADSLDEDASLTQRITKICVSDMDTIFNAKTHKFEKFPETSIVNSAETDKEVVSAVLSIIGLIGTSNQFIAGRH
jgi:chaperonin GroEL